MYTLPNLKFGYDALAPHIDATTMEIHHTKHHQAYITKLNEALDKYPDLKQKTLYEILTNLESVPEDIRATVRNNGGGHLNHSMFWELLSPTPTSLSPDLENAITDTFGSLEKFKEEFVNAALTRFGSGWAWLSLTTDKKLVIHSTANQDSPIMEGLTPLLGLDVWEHAYYLNYQNKRPDYATAFWNVVNFEQVSQNYSNAMNK